jgi:hypothetical protein
MRDVTVPPKLPHKNIESICDWRLRPRQNPIMENLGFCAKKNNFLTEGSGINLIESDLIETSF